MAVVTWRGFTLGQGSPYRIQKISGWESRPPSRSQDEDRANGHGVHIGSLYGDQRIVTIEGVVVDPGSTARLIETLEAVTPLVSAIEEFTVTVYGRTLRAGARCINRDLPQELSYNTGVTRWMLQWACPNPLRYGAPVSDSTPLPLAGGGLVYGLVYPLSYGSAGVSGRVVVSNPGSAEASLLLAVRGGLPQGWQVSAAGRALTYPVEVPAGQTVVVDTAAGTVLVEGTASRRGNLTQADWLQVPAAAPPDPVTGAPGAPGQLELQFTSLGGARDPDALLTATVAGAYW